MVSEDDLLKFALSLGEVTQKEDEKTRFLMRGEKIFLALSKGMTPVRVEVRCERQLSKTLQERFESAMGGRLLGRNGLEIVCSGQLSFDEICDLVRLSYNLSVEE